MHVSLDEEECEHSPDSLPEGAVASVGSGEHTNRSNAGATAAKGTMRIVQAGESAKGQATATVARLHCSSRAPYASIFLALNPSQQREHSRLSSSGSATRKNAQSNVVPSLTQSVRFD